MVVGIKECAKMYAKKFGVSVTKADTYIRNTLDIIDDAVADKGGVRFENHFSITAVDRAARVGRNPSTGEVIEIPAKKGIKFKASQSMKDSVQ